MDAVFTNDAFACWNKKSAHTFYENFKKTTAKLIVTVHSSMGNLVHNKSVDHCDNLLTHHNLYSVIIYRPGYYDDIVGMYNDKHHLNLVFNNQNDYIVHKPYVGYLDDSKVKPWDERENNLGFTGRTSADKKYYVYLRGISSGHSESFDNYYYATGKKGAFYWDLVKYDDEIDKFSDKQKSKFHYIDQYTTEDVPSIVGNLRYLAIPTMKPDMEFPGEWVTQEAMYLGTIPIHANLFDTDRVPEELSFLRKFTHQTTTKSIPDYDSMVSQFTDAELKSFSDKLIKYSHKHWNSLTDCRNHLYGVIEGKKQSDLAEV